MQGVFVLRLSPFTFHLSVLNWHPVTIIPEYDLVQVSSIFRERRFVVLLLAAATLGVFARCGGMDFVHLDDWDNIACNQALHPPTLEGVVEYWKNPHAGLYVPLTHTFWAVVAVGAQLGVPDPRGSLLNPWVFHLANVLIHLASVLVVYSLLLFLLRSHHWAACAGALLFALHPVQVEAVAWVSGTKDLLYGLLCLVAIRQYLQFVVSPGPTPGGRNSRRDRVAAGHKDRYRASLDSTCLGDRARLGHYLLATSAFVAAMLCKPTAIVTPLLIFSIDYWIVKRPWRQICQALLPWVVLALPFLVIARHVQDVAGVPAAAWYWRPLVAGDALTFYLRQLLWPVLAVDYGRNPATLLAKPWFWADGVIPLLTALWLWRRRRAHAWLAASAVIFAGALLPTLGLATFQFQYYSTVADHYLYLAMLGPALLLGRMAYRFPHKFTALACGILLFCLGLASLAQVGYWQDDTTLWEHNLEVNPDSLLATINLGSAENDLHHAAHAGELFLKAISLRPNHPTAHFNISLLYIAAGNLRDAHAHALKLMDILRTLPPERARAYLPFFAALGKNFAELGYYRQAIPYLEEARRLEGELKISPDVKTAEKLATCREKMEQSATLPTSRPNR